MRYTVCIVLPSVFCIIHSENIKYCMYGCLQYDLVSYALVYSNDQSNNAFLKYLPMHIYCNN